MREIRYCDRYIILKRDGSPAELHVSRETSTDILTMLENDIIASRKDKAEYFISFIGLKYYNDIIINAYYHMGYNIHQGNKKDLLVGEYRLRQSPNGETYYIQIKTGYKSYVTYQAADPVISLKQMPQTTEEAEKALKLYHYVRHQFLDGTKNGATRILYSSASISRTMMMREYTGLSALTMQLKRTYMRDEQGHRVLTNRYLEEFCRPGVHGGINFVSELGYDYKGEGIVLDNNSLYPWVSSDAYIPIPNIIEHGFGTPSMEYVKRPGRYYMIMKVAVTAALKRDGIKCICPDGNNRIGSPHYLYNMKKRVLTMTPSDRAMLFDNYNVSYYSIKEYIVFDVKKGFFNRYVSPLYEKKCTHSGIERDFNKLLLNGFIGVFARQVFKTEYEYVERDGYIIAEKTMRTAEEVQKEYNSCSGLAFINMAIVSEAKRRMVEIIKKHYDRFLYTDTDSLHLAGNEIPEEISISDKIGEFKVEHQFTQCTYKGIKQYMLVEDNKIVQCVSGIPKDALYALPDKISGVDIKGIKYNVSHLRLDALFEKPIAIWTIQSEIETGEIYMACGKAYLKKLDKPKSRRTENISEWSEWHDSYVTMPEMFKETREEAESDKLAQDYNTYFATPGRSFDEAVDILRWIRDNGTKSAYNEMFAS